MRARRMPLSGWGRWPRAEMDCYRPERMADVPKLLAMGGGLVVRGGGRSYGDQALNAGGAALLTARLDRLLSFDPESGLLVAEPGVTFGELMRIFLPRGWIVPVSPGTGFASLGGAVANDVHGKNHDRAGSFGDHVRWLDLVLPTGELKRVSPTEDRALFRATIGGMGLTGVIAAVAFAMARTPSNAVELTETRIADLDDFIARLADSRDRATYSVGWIDALARGGAMGRGILQTAEPAAEGVAGDAPKRRAVPVDLPGLALNPLSVRLFNRAYYGRVPAAGRQRRVTLESFFYPLDAVADWNRIYGKRGFHQFQCVVPDEEAPRALPRMMEAISKAGAASFLAVLKTLGGGGRGMLSFPMRGFTLALDFPHRAASAELLGSLERMTLDHGGRIYLAKDSLLSQAGFRAMYPEAEAFRALLDDLDPQGRLVSDMARRLGLKGAA